jgi:RHS repeat-associated protein
MLTGGAMDQIDVAELSGNVDNIILTGRQTDGRHSTLLLDGRHHRRWYQPGDRVTTFTYNALDQVTSRTTPGAGTWTSTYDDLGRLTSHSDPNTGTRTMSYDAVGNLTATTDARNVTIAAAYDLLGRQAREWDTATPSVNLATWTYNNSGADYPRTATASRRDTNGRTWTHQYGYDSRGRVTSTSLSFAPAFANSNLSGPWTVNRAFDGLGNPTSHTMPLPATTNGGPLGSETVTSTYHGDGSVDTTTVAGTDLMSSAYDMLGRPVTLTGTVAGGPSFRRMYTYDARGRLDELRATAGDGVAQSNVQWLQHRYNELDNVVSIADIRRTEFECFRYDARNQLIAAYTSAPTTSHCSDDAVNTGVYNGPTPNTGTNPYDLAWTTKANTSLTSEVNAAGASTNYQYNLPAPNTPSSIGNTSLTYNAIGARTGSTSTGSAPTAPPPVTYEAEAASTDASFYNDWPGYTGTGFLGWWPGTGTFVQFTVNAPTTGNYKLDFKYTAAAGAGTRNLSVNGGATSGVNFPGTSGWAAWATTTVPLTAGTNIIRLTLGTAHVNLDNLEVTPQPTSGTGTTTTTYAWDPNGRLAATTVNSATTTNSYAADGSRIARSLPDNTVTIYLDGVEITASTTTQAVPSAQRHYVHGGRTVATRTPDNNIHWLIGNHQGSAVATVQRGTTTVTDHRYQPYGRPRTGTPSTLPTNRDFLGQTHDDTTNLTYLNNRYYDPTTNTFISVDPLNADTAQPYTYAGNNPSSDSDPTGLMCLGCGLVGPLDSYGSGLGAGAGTSQQMEMDRQANERRQVLGAVATRGQPVVDDYRYYQNHHLIYDGGLGLWDAVSSIGGFIPYVGETLDMGGCLAGDNWSCGGVLIPFMGGRLPRVLFRTPSPTGVYRATNTADDLAGAACRSNSFVPGTEVLMADGTTKPIEDIEVGDMVLAADPETGERGPRRVIDTIVGDGVKQLVDVEVRGAVVTSTDRHPFWVDDRGEWIDAGDLEVGDELTASDGTTVVVKGVGERVEVRRVHNLTVEGIHTYFVIAGTNEVLVHNCIRNGHLAGQTHPTTGVPFDDAGFPDFAAWRHPDVPDVRIQLSGSRSTDFARADAAAGITGQRPAGYTWHGGF